MLLCSIALQPVPVFGQSSSSVFDLRAAYHYITSQYNHSLGLVRENEHIEKYWLWSDNELAALVLRDYAPAVSENITNSVVEYVDGYTEFRSAYGTILGKDPSFQAPINKNITDKIWFTDFAGDSELQCADYADIAFLKAIHYYKIGDYRRSNECYQAGSEMFDGAGFRDGAYAADGNRYSTYKVALWQIANDLTRRGDPDVAEQTREILGKMQDRKTGGVYTHYTSNLTPDGQTNVETTSLAILALDSSLLEPKVPSATTEILQRCAELGIKEEECSERAILGMECLGMSCGSTERDQIEVLQNPTMLAMFGLLAAGIGSVSAIFFIKTRKRGGKKETGP
jgi:hypothetical protein